MFIKENIMLAIAGLKSNKMRALLTMLGIIIGIASVIGVVSVGNAMTSNLTSSMASMGATNITINVQERSTTSTPTTNNKSSKNDGSQSERTQGGGTTGGSPGGATSGGGSRPQGGGASSAGGVMRAAGGGASWSQRCLSPL